VEALGIISAIIAIGLLVFSVSAHHIFTVGIDVHPSTSECFVTPSFRLNLSKHIKNYLNSSSIFGYGNFELSYKYINKLIFFHETLYIYIYIYIYIYGAQSVHKSKISSDVIRNI
jgi:heme/copper-type cytochrome/quinol oxidase subunit 1